MNAKGPRERRHLRTRQAILDAAEQILVERGIEALSMREIASRIEYSPSGLYEYFASKEELIGAICMEGFSRLTDYVRAIPEDLSPAQRLIEAGMAYIKFGLRYPQHYLLMFTNDAIDPIPLDKLAENSAYGELMKIVRTGVETGMFRSTGDSAVEMLTYKSWALVHGLTMLRLTIMQHSVEDLDTLHRRIIENTVEGICV